MLIVQKFRDENRSVYGVASLLLCLSCQKEIHREAFVDVDVGKIWYNDASLILLPETAWEYTPETPIMNIEGLFQGAFKKQGTGRLVVFAEASLFSAQIGDPGRRKMGMNSENAGDNYRLLLNAIHWLDGLLD